MEVVKEIMVVAYCQKADKWARMTLGKTRCTMAKYGCFVTAMAMIDERTPDVVLKILNDTGKCFNYEGELYSEIAGHELGLEFDGYNKLEYVPDRVCVAETNHYRLVHYPQHFFVWLGDGKIIDSLDGELKPNPYHIVSYRMFRKKKGG